MMVVLVSIVRMALMQAWAMLTHGMFLSSAALTNFYIFASSVAFNSPFIVGCMRSQRNGKRTR